MYLLIPVDKDKTISKLSNVDAWVVVTLENGNKTDERYYASKKEIKEFVDFIIVKDKDEEIEEFLDEGIDVLIAPCQKSLDEVVEAFIFRELYEIGG